MAGLTAESSLNIAEQKRLLLENANRYDFFHAVRVIERQLLQESASFKNKIGHDAHPSHEKIKFKVNQSLSFPANSIYKIIEKDGDSRQFTVEMLVSFFGLTGSKGVLPQHYSELILQQERKKDYTLANFLDIFNHRLLSLFYRAWEKYRIGTHFENHIRTSRTDDGFSQCLGNITGSMSSGFSHDTIYYGGYFARRVRSATALKNIISDMLHTEVSINQFAGQWLFLQREDQSRIGSAKGFEGYNRLGSNLMLGKRVWDAQSKFIVEIKPNSAEQFNQLIPGSDLYIRLCKTVRQFSGGSANFDIRMLLPPEDIPACQLGRNIGFIPRLGWNTWTKKRSRVQVAKHAVFHVNAYN